MGKRLTVISLAVSAAVVAVGAWVSTGAVTADRSAGGVAGPASGTPRPAASARASALRAGSAAQAPAKPLAGKIIGIDPGHNGRNYANPAYINHKIWNGRQWEACDTTGTQTNSGYTEPRFTFRVARFLRADLVRAGARVVMTRGNNHGMGPCVSRRSRILNRKGAVVSVDIHGDGGPAWGRGFSILEPVRDGPNDKVIRSSRRLGRDVKAALLAGAPMPVSDYYGHNGFAFRDDLAGLNLTTQPKVLIECGNMRNAADARLLASARFQRRLARALEKAIVKFLTKR